MLPAEAFAEAVAFLGLFDLSALAVTNALCSLLAVKASRSIRCEEFPGIHFDVTNISILVYRFVKDDAGQTRRQRLVDLYFSDAAAVAEFIAAAFPNCIFENVDISCVQAKRVLDVIAHVADSFTIKGVLCLPSEMSHDVSLNLVRRFRKVKALELLNAVEDEKIGTLANFFTGSGIEVLYYHRSEKRDGLYYADYSRARYFPL